MIFIFQIRKEQLFEIEIIAYKKYFLSHILFYVILDLNKDKS
jgi:hypothetical protein